MSSQFSKYAESGTSSINVPATVFTDTATASSGTASLAYTNYIGQHLITSANSSVTTTTAANLYIDGAPLSNGSGRTITSSAGLYVGTGGSASTGTNTSTYGLYTKTPSAGTNKVAIYSDNAAIGYTGITPPSNGIIVAGNVGVGTSAPSASAVCDLTSSTQGLLPPRMTTAQKLAISSPASGLVVFDTDLNKLCIKNGTAWVALKSDYESYDGLYNDIKWLYRQDFSTTTTVMSSTVPPRTIIGTVTSQSTYYAAKWVGKYMMGFIDAVNRAPSTSATYPNTYPSVLFTVNVTPNMHNVFAVEVLSGDRFIMAYAYAVISGPSGGNYTVTPLGSSTTNYWATSGDLTVMSSRVGPWNSTAGTTYSHEWISWVIPKTVVGSSSTVQIIIARSNNANNNNDSFWASAFCTASNPYGYSYQSAMECYQKCNSVYTTTPAATTASWVGNDWNHEALASVPSLSSFIGVIRTPWQDTSEVTDIYIGIVNNNDRVEGIKGYIEIGLSTTGVGGGVFKTPSSMTRSRSSKIVSGVGGYRRCYEVMFTKAEVLASGCLNTTAGGIFISPTFCNGSSAEEYCFRGIYMEQVYAS